MTTHPMRVEVTVYKESSKMWQGIGMGNMPQM